MSNIFDYLTKQNIGEPYILTPTTLLISILVTSALSVVMLITYKLCNDSLTYNKKFNTTLLMMAFLSTILIALVQNNPIISIGVIGSLSIVRVRTNTKDPRDLGFIFWALSIGISSAVGAFTVGLVSTAILSVVLILLNKSIREKDTLLVVVRGEKHSFNSVQNTFKDFPKCSLYSKNIFHDSYELVYEIYSGKSDDKEIIDSLNNVDGVTTVNILAPETRVV